MRALPLLLLCLTTGCAEVRDSARRSAADAAGRATGRAVERTIDGAAARATESASRAGNAPTAARGGPALDCQALLPDADVARVCRVRTVDGDAVNERPDECSRTYAARGGSPEAGLALVVNAQATLAQARVMVQIGGTTGGAARALPDLGDGGMASTLEAPAVGGMGYTEHAVTFSTGATVVSLKAAQVDRERPALCTEAQIETLARGVAARLGR